MATTNVIKEELNLFKIELMKELKAFFHENPSQKNKI